MVTISTFTEPINCDNRSSGEGLVKKKKGVDKSHDMTMRPKEKFRNQTESF